MGKRFLHGFIGAAAAAALYCLVWVLIPELTNFPGVDGDYWYVPVIAIGGAAVLGFIAGDVAGYSFWEDFLTHLKISVGANLAAFMVLLTCDLVYMIMHPDWEGILGTVLVLGLVSMPTVWIIRVIFE